MKIRKTIMALPLTAHRKIFTTSWFRKTCADLAETRESELLSRLNTVMHNYQSCADKLKQAESQCEQLLRENAQLLSKVEIYERLLHLIQLNVNVTMNAKVMQQLIGNICNWSYAHRAGNGELSDDEQELYIKKAFDKLLNTDGILK